LERSFHQISASVEQVAGGRPRQLPKTSSNKPAGSSVPNNYYEKRADGLLLKLHVQPGAAKTGLAGEHDGRLKIRVSAAAVDGAANECLCRFLSHFFKVSKSSVSIVHGAKSRRKNLLVTGDANLLARPIDELFSAGRET
jgi:uncharacterized protein (TIGR00251 family)